MLPYESDCAKLLHRFTSNWSLFESKWIFLRSTEQLLKQTKRLPKLETFNEKEIFRLPLFVFRTGCPKMITLIKYSEDACPFSYSNVFRSTLRCLSTIIFHLLYKEVAPCTYLACRGLYSIESGNSVRM